MDSIKILYLVTIAFYSFNLLGSSKCILFPTCDQQVSAILKHCYSRNIAVVPQSGNTSLVGGSVPVYDEVILSIRKLNQHFAFDPYSGMHVSNQLL